MNMNLHFLKGLVKRLAANFDGMAVFVYGIRNLKIKFTFFLMLSLRCVENLPNKKATQGVAFVCHQTILLFFHRVFFRYPVRFYSFRQFEHFCVFKTQADERIVGRLYVRTAGIRAAAAVHNNRLGFVLHG